MCIQICILFFLASLNLGKNSSRGNPTALSRLPHNFLKNCCMYLANIVFCKAVSLFNSAVCTTKYISIHIALVYFLTFTVTKKIDIIYVYMYIFERFLPNPRKIMSPRVLWSPVFFVAPFSPMLSSYFYFLFFFLLFLTLCALLLAA